MASVLDLHSKFPRGKESLKRKSAHHATKFKTPRDYPSLTKYQPKINYKNNVARSCVHCHQIHDAQRRWHREKRAPIPDTVLYPWPIPEVVGITFASKMRSRIASVLPGSAAAEAGIRAGDDLNYLEGQPIVSVADVQWVLHNAGSEASLPIVVERNGKPVSVALKLQKGWRTKTDFGWRTSTWDLRRMVLGGMYLAPLDKDARKKTGIADGEMALVASHVGQHGEHAIAKRAGVRKGDIVISADDHKSSATEAGLIAYLLQNAKPGTRVEFTYLRGKSRKTAAFRMK